ncbi:3332_t:CDS:2 [Racocetra fulgida]|uniref:3332_t:CDS:1 n=1 Tax=Racocetra fulgida TaxID=60492 RepID=A0A9N9BTS3_9GLOM|nr:3332_t:CDS:2 [Racocetra fulgida]
MHSPSFPQLFKTQTSKEISIPTTKLKIFLIQTAMGLYSASGGYKANLCFLAALSSQVEYSEEKCSFGDKNNHVTIYRFIWNNVEIVGLELDEYLKIFPKSTLFHPLKYVEERITRWLEHLPFGPYSGAPGFDSPTSLIEHKRLKKIEGVWAVSRAIKHYIEIYGEGVLATYLPLHPTTFGEPPFKKYHNFDAPYVLIPNPASIKGYAIFKELTEKMPDIQFAAVKNWGVSEYQLKEMENTENIMYEAFGIVVVEAMLRGIPVICSDAGGLPEAKCGVTFGTIHVNITCGERESDESIIEKTGVYKIPPQNIEPWIQSLRHLINNREAYEKIGQECREKAIAFIESINIEIYEKWLKNRT